MPCLVARQVVSAHRHCCPKSRTDSGAFVVCLLSLSPQSVASILCLVYRTAPVGYLRKEREMKLCALLST